MTIAFSSMIFRICKSFGYLDHPPLLAKELSRGTSLGMSHPFAKTTLDLNQISKFLPHFCPQE
jgi:hypothetical protein